MNWRAPSDWPFSRCLSLAHAEVAGRRDLIAFAALEADMRARNEVTVDRLEIKRATGWTRRGKIGAQDKTYLLMEQDGFTVVAPCATTTIKSAGRWEGEVAVAAIALKRLVAALPPEKEVRLTYFDGWLIVGGKTRLSASNSFFKEALARAPDPGLQFE